MEQVSKYRVSIAVDGRHVGMCLTFAGGEGDSEDQKIRPYGGAAELSLGGPGTVGNVTVTLLANAAILADLPRLYRARGRKDASTSWQPLDTDDNPFGDPLVYTGKFKRVTPVQADSSSADPAAIELEHAVSGDPS